MTPTFSWNLEKITIGISFQRAQNVCIFLQTFENILLPILIHTIFNLNK